MGLASEAIVLPLGLMFFVSGFFINILQALSLIFLLPFSRKAYRIANVMMMEVLWSELVWLVDWWAGVKLRVYADPLEWTYIGKEHALLICNHRSDIDWLVGWVLAERVGCLGGCRAVMKNSMKFLPVMGWSMWFSEYVFLERSWAKDEKTLKSGFLRLKNFPRPFWLALFVEGTRFTPEKLKAAQDYAVSAGIQVPQNVLIPRTKGFVSAVFNLRSFVPAIYDVTIAISKDSPAPTMRRLLRGQSSVIHVHLKRHPMSELPQSADEVAKWCKDAFIAKDDFLEKHKAENTFGEHLYQPLSSRSIKPLIAVIGWAFVLLVLAVILLRPLLSTRYSMYTEEVQVGNEFRYTLLPDSRLSFLEVLL
ncbi:hypothetical protein O6H91_22G061400 [Diphasiastrum complanatum]|uniref:Uncharacterized protein n=1 Tax=Diphasiastrum complanatum TaxID=34168 RepID=A0ACC2AG99_DIPCM|nr:hypothetical protein O6H91_22G061400 [Diphasiastrum complanatum]